MAGRTSRGGRLTGAGTLNLVCCHDDVALDLPPAVIEMVARYRRMRAEQGVGWGEVAFPDMFRWARFARLGPAFDAFAASGSWAGAVRAAVGDAVPAGLVLVAIGADGGLTLRTGPPRPVIEGATVSIDVVLDSAADHDVVVTVDGEDVPVDAGGAGLRTVDATGAAITLSCGDARRTGYATAAVPAATLRLRSPEGARWSVVDATGGAWFADGVPAKWDAADRPFFHTDPGTVEVAVPAGPLHVIAARGLEFAQAAFDLEPDPGEVVDVEFIPVRRFDPPADGWFGGDLHVHLNYSGDHVLEPADARRMQRGEGLALLHLTAGNLTGALVYDRELLTATAGADLWPGARAGLEFRNDLLGHVHGLGLTSVPPVLHTGHEGTDHPWDWPPNSAACADMRERGAVTTYAHPVFAPDGDGPDELFRPFRMVEARELVADAALGLVDAVELVSCFDDRGALVLYHHLLSCGLRLAAVAGTDTFLSFARGPAPASNPPGWGRVYAHLDGAPLSVEAFAAAVRAGRTVVTNGPWLTLHVDGGRPGAVLDRRRGDRVRISARTVGSGVDRLLLYGPDGELAATDGDRLEHEVTVDDGLWLAAAAHGGTDPHTVGAPVFAHTTPVYVDVDGCRVGRAASARWCLRLLDGLADLAAEQGRFDPDDRDRQLADLVAVLDRARIFYRTVAAGVAAEG
jgi:hypothetical protein